MTEEQYLELVIGKLHTKIEEIEQKLEVNSKDIESMHDYYWENNAEFDEYGYERYDNNMALQQGIKEQTRYQIEKARYEKMLYAPYFGRVDFCYEGEEESESYYIGIGNLAEKRAADPYVFDWRAPVASLFYDYDKGEASFEAPSGMINGEITRKKQYKIKNGKLVYVLENDINIDDEILQQTLSENADAKLKSIVNTIQKEQNSIIRDRSHRILAVQGCAGSGKTSVALHRIAYLLYHNRQKMSASQILILSPNSIFADYISRILPELGEENICEMTFDVFAYRELTDIGEAEDKYDEIEKELAGLDENERTEAAYRQTKAYVTELDGFILELEYEIVNFRNFRYKKMSMKENDIATMFYEKFCDVPIFSRMDKIADYIIDEHETLMGRTLDEEDEFNVRAKLKSMYEVTDIGLLYNRFLEGTGREPIDLTKGVIPYEDVYPMLYLKYSTLEPPKRRLVKHLIIDEMQDYSYVQYRLIEMMFKCPMTILGDRMQTMAEEQQDVLKFLPGIFGKDVYKVELDKSYRSTSEIMKFAAELAGDSNSRQVERHGEAPVEIKADTQDGQYELMKQKISELYEYDTIAVLTQTQAQAQEIAEGLKNKGIDISLLTKDSMKFNTGISCMPFYLAKGLEFDAVLVPNMERYTTPLHRQALYIDATRALHKLAMFRVEEK